VAHLTLGRSSTELRHRVDRRRDLTGFHRPLNNDCELETTPRLSHSRLQTLQVGRSGHVKRQLYDNRLPESATTRARLDLPEQVHTRHCSRAQNRTSEPALNHIQTFGSTQLISSGSPSMSRSGRSVVGRLCVCRLCVCRLCV